MSGEHIWFHPIIYLKDNGQCTVLDRHFALYAHCKTQAISSHYNFYDNRSREVHFNFCLSTWPLKYCFICKQFSANIDLIAIEKENNFLSNVTLLNLFLFR
jgi:hypothetical protein